MGLLAVHPTASCIAMGRAHISRLLTIAAIKLMRLPKRQMHLLRLAGVVNQTGFRRNADFLASHVGFRSIMQEVYNYTALINVHFNVCVVIPL